MINYLYCSKKEVRTGEDGYPSLKKDGQLVLFLTDPTEQEIKKVVKEFSVSEENIRNYKKVSYSRRISLDPFQFVFVDYTLKEDKVIKTKNLFIMQKNFLILVSQEKQYSEFLKILADELRNDPTKKRISYLLYRLLEEDVEENYAILKMMEHRTNNIEDNLAEQKDIEPKELIFIKKDLVILSKSFWASTKIIFSIKNGLVPVLIDKRDTVILEDIYHTLQHQIDIIYSQREIVTDLLQIHVSNISNSLNKVMKTLTALTVMVAVPTLIGSIYGMNFQHMPFQDVSYGFYVILLMILFTSLSISYYFFRKKWF